MFPESLLTGLRLQPLTSHGYIVGDGRMIEFPYGQAVIEIGGAARVCPAIFGPNYDALFGATTLEIFKLVADPDSRSLLPAGFSPLGWGGRA